MTVEHTEQIRSYILKLIDARDKNFVHKTVETFGISKSSVYNYVKRMCEEGLLQKAEGAASYALVTEVHEFFYENDGSLGEDSIFRRDVEPLLAELEKNVRSAWQYAFTEMMNNAIEHSRAKRIWVTVCKNALQAEVCIEDDGVGIFKNIQSFLKEERGEDVALEECVALLFAGKFTTAKRYHSGEGIFFTSHLMDEFFILSDGITFTRDNFAEYTVKGKTGHGGTLVSMALSHSTKKTTREVFDRFSDVEEGFIRTHVPISHMFAYGNPISRSEARRLGQMIDPFKEITLDFSGVEEVGQAFCHELFVVWQRDHADVTLTVENASEDVDFMIRRVKNTK